MPGATSNWVLSLARSYRRLTKDKRRRGRLRAVLQTATNLGATSSGSLPMMDQPGWMSNGWSSNTDDSGYEAGYETDADESELSEWESGNTRQGHKRKLDALVLLTKRLSVVESPEAHAEEVVPASEETMGPPARVHKAPRALGTQPVGLRLPLPHATSSHQFPPLSGLRLPPPPMAAILSANADKRQLQQQEQESQLAFAASGLTLMPLPASADAAAMEVG